MQRSRAIPPFASLMTVSSNAVSRAVGRPTRRRVSRGFPSYFLRTADYASLNARRVRHDDWQGNLPGGSEMQREMFKRKFLDR